MATVGNERYLRHIWLLGEGGLLVLRGIVTRETALSGQPLEHILANKRSLFNNILREQKLALFPTSSTVNQDVNTWDMSLLLLVIKRIFWSKLSPADQSFIETLKTYRNNIQGHPKSLSMEKSDYDTNRVVVEDALRKLAKSLGAHCQSEIEDIIKNSASGDIDIGSVLGRIKDLLEYDTTLKSLENKIDLANSTLSAINNSLSDMAVSSERDFRETKDEQQRMLQIVSDMAQLNRRYILDQTRRQKSKDLKTIVQAKCSSKEKEKKAIELLYSVVKIIQGGSTFSENEIKTVIAQRIGWHGELTVTLIEDVIDWFKDINDNPDTSVGEARLGSIRLPIKCSSMGGLLRHFDYMNGGESQSRLLNISEKISKQLGFSCILSWSVVPESVPDVFEALYKLTEPSKLVLPFKTTSVKGLQNIWKMFGGKDKKTHLLNISETLSKIFEENILLTAAVEKDQFQTALLEMGMPRYCSEKKLKKSCGVQTELEIDAQTSKCSPVIPNIGIQDMCETRSEKVDKTHKYTSDLRHQRRRKRQRKSFSETELPAYEEEEKKRRKFSTPYTYVIPGRTFPGYRQRRILNRKLARKSEGKIIGYRQVKEETDDDDEFSDVVKILQKKKETELETEPKTRPLDLYSSKSRRRPFDRPTIVESRDYLPYCTPVIPEIKIQTETIDKTHKYTRGLYSSKYISWSHVRPTNVESEDDLPYGIADLLVPTKPIRESLWRPSVRRTKIETQPKIKDNPPSRSPDEPTWYPEVNLFTDYEKEAPKEEIEDKTHTPIPGHKET